MPENNSLQDRILSHLQQKRQVATVIVINGFQAKGRITAFDPSTIILEIRNEQRFINRAVVSTISPDIPIDLGALEEGASQC